MASSPKVKNKKKIIEKATRPEQCTFIADVVCHHAGKYYEAGDPHVWSPGDDAPSSHMTLKEGDTLPDECAELIKEHDAAYAKKRASKAATSPSDRLSNLELKQEIAELKLQLAAASKPNLE